MGKGPTLGMIEGVGVRYKLQYTCVYLLVGGRPGYPPLLINQPKAIYATNLPEIFPEICCTTQQAGQSNSCFNPCSFPHWSGGVFCPKRIQKGTVVFPPSHPVFANKTPADHLDLVKCKPKKLMLRTNNEAKLLWIKFEQKGIRMGLTSAANTISGGKALADRPHLQEEEASYMDDALAVNGPRNSKLLLGLRKVLAT